MAGRARRCDATPRRPRENAPQTTHFGGPFSFRRRQRVGLFGVGAPNDQSLYPDRRSSRVRGRSNCVNPGLWLLGAGVDFELAPEARLANNANVLWFDKTNSREVLAGLDQINRYVGVDLSRGRGDGPRLNNTRVLFGGLSTRIPGSEMTRLFNPTGTGGPRLLAAFVAMNLAF